MPAGRTPTKSAAFRLSKSVGSGVHDAFIVSSNSRRCCRAPALISFPEGRRCFFAGWPDACIAAARWRFLVASSDLSCGAGGTVCGSRPARVIPLLSTRCRRAIAALCLRHP